MVDDETRAAQDALVIAERMVRLTALEERVDDIAERLAVVEDALEARPPTEAELLQRLREERADRNPR